MKLNKNGSALLLGVMVAAVIATILMKAYSSYVTIHTRILVDQREKTDIVIAKLIAEKAEVQDLLDELESATSDIPRVCEPNDAVCNSKCASPQTCRHNQQNGKTVQSCEGDCVLTEGVWYKGGTECSLGMECKK